MAMQKVWHEELQDWVYEDSDTPKNLDFDNLKDFGIPVCARKNANHDLSRACLPLSILEGRSSYVGGMSYE